jgi:hypothetical protein
MCAHACVLMRIFQRSLIGVSLFGWVHGCMLFARDSRVGAQVALSHSNAQFGAVYFSDQAQAAAMNGSGADSGQEERPPEMSEDELVEMLTQLFLQVWMQWEEACAGA